MTEERRYIEGTTVANVSLHVTLYKSYLDKDNKQQFELITADKKRFSARIPSEEISESVSQMKENMEKSMQPWNVIRVTQSGVI